MMDEAEVTQRVSPEIKLLAARRAGQRARNARWDLDVAVFLFAILIIVIILLFQGVGIEVVAPIAIFGLAMVWLVGWRRGKQLYGGYYQEELAKLERDLERKRKPVAAKVEEAIEETIEEKVQKALRERWR